MKGSSTSLQPGSSHGMKPENHQLGRSEPISSDVLRCRRHKRDGRRLKKRTGIYSGVVKGFKNTYFSAKIGGGEWVNCCVMKSEQTRN